MIALFLEMQTVLDEVQALKKIMVTKIQKAESKVKKYMLNYKILQFEYRTQKFNILKFTVYKNENNNLTKEVSELENQILNLQKNSKIAIDKLISEIAEKDQQIERISEAYRLQKTELNKLRRKDREQSASKIALKAELKRSKTRIASMGESLEAEKVLREITKQNIMLGSSVEKVVDNSKKTTVGLKSSKAVENYKRFTEKAVEWMACLDPQSSDDFRERAIQVLPSLILLKPYWFGFHFY